MHRDDLVTAEVSVSASSVASLKSEQEKTLSSSRRRYGLLARVLFWGMDIVYGRKRTVSKFKVLEVIARVPYQSWEHVAYIAMTHTYSKPGFARRIYEFVKQNPGFEREPFESAFEADYGHFESLADLFRQIGLDERHHKEESFQRIANARFS